MPGYWPRKDRDLPPEVLAQTLALRYTSCKPMLEL